MSAETNPIAPAVDDATSATQTPFARARAFLELGKPNLGVLVVATSVLGFVLGRTSVEPFPWLRLAALAVGTGLTSAGACAMNMVLEHDVDRRMRRTRMRPIPDGRLGARESLAFSVILFSIGFLVLLVGCGLRPALLSLGTAAVYAFLYTPLKRRGPIAIWVGAIPGAIPPLMGWSAATHSIDAGAWSLFLVLFAWQFPHFLALAFVYRDDYQRAGFRFLPANDADGRLAGRAIAIGCVAVVAASVAPFVAGIAGPKFLVGAAIAGTLFLLAGMRVARASTTRSARTAFFASILYLPGLSLCLVVDRFAS